MTSAGPAAGTWFSRSEEAGWTEDSRRFRGGLSHAARRGPSSEQ